MNVAKMIFCNLTVRYNMKHSAVKQNEGSIPFQISYPCPDRFTSAPCSSEQWCKGWWWKSPPMKWYYHSAIWHLSGFTTSRYQIKSSAATYLQDLN